MVVNGHHGAVCCVGTHFVCGKHLRGWAITRGAMNIIRLCMAERSTGCGSAMWWNLRGINSHDACSAH
eukprot:8730170-Alexandrium_andersonii.AAC.1